jgi:PBP1b-binding outer membrane lipoprotein LpoB
MKLFSLLLIITSLLLSCSEEKTTSQEEQTTTEEQVLPISTASRKAYPAKKPIDTTHTVESLDTQEESEVIVKQSSKKETQVVAQVKEENAPSSNVEKTAKEESSIEKVEAKKVISIHAMFNTLLSKYVSNNGDVDYANFKKEHNKLTSYINTLKKINYKTLNKNEQLAFLINLYNALTLDLMLKNYPLKSITDLTKPWDTPVITYQGKALTLNNIEHQLIRENFKEPRIHFACNCAAKSCPKLLNSAYEGSTLEKQLDTQTKSFLNNKSKNSIATNELKISKIFLA